MLAFLDHGFVAPYLNQVYNEHFGNHQLRLQYGKRVTPLFSLTIDDLENTLPFTHGCALAAILESFYRANRNMYGELSLSSVPALSRVTPGKDVVRERFRQFDLDLHDGLFRS